MRRFELEHIIRAASAITKQDHIVVVGSQAILGQFPNAAQRLLVSMEADVFPIQRPELSIEIDGNIGENSTFHQTHGYYAHGVGEDTATLPDGWRQRLVPIHNPNTNNATGWCLDIHDLVTSKLVAGREKDMDFVAVILQKGMVQKDLLEQRIATLPIAPERIVLVQARLTRLAGRDDRKPSVGGSIE